LPFHHERYGRECLKIGSVGGEKMLKNIKEILKDDHACPCIGIPMMLLTGKNPMMWMMDLLGKK
jgi:hypothetical protein